MVLRSPGPATTPVRLSVGRHHSPAQGACAMELAALLAGEPFTDRPACVDPVVAAYMRGFNDRLGDLSRQRLEPYVRLAMGTRGDRAATRERRRRCLAFAAGRRTPPRFARLRVLAVIGVRGAVQLDAGAAFWALRAVDRRGLEPAGFPLLEALLDRRPQPRVQPLVRRPPAPAPADAEAPVLVGA